MKPKPLRLPAAELECQCQLQSRMQGRHPTLKGAPARTRFRTDEKG
jgi:hypothetical protein